MGRCTAVLQCWVAVALFAAFGTVSDDSTAHKPWRLVLCVGVCSVMYHKTLSGLTALCNCQKLLDTRAFPESALQIVHIASRVLSLAALAATVFTESSSTWQQCPRGLYNYHGRPIAGSAVTNSGWTAQAASSNQMQDKIDSTQLLTKPFFGL